MLNNIFTFENLYKAHLKARLTKRYKKEVIEFELSLSNNLYSILNEIKTKTYQVSEYNEFYIHDPKTRIIQALSYKERIIQHCFCDNYLTSLLETKLIYDNCACRKDKGVDFARKRFKEKLVKEYKNSKQNFYILKCDIKRYFESIDHDILKKQLRKIIKSEPILEFTNKIIDSFNFEIKKGIPIGNQTSQAFGIYYLDKIDRLIKEKLRIKNYIRYMDDFILIHEDKIILKNALEKIKEVTSNLNLELNHKTQIIPIKNGIDFLGFRYKVLSTGKIKTSLIRSKKKIMLRKIKEKKYQLKHNKVTISSYKATIASYKGYFKKANEDKHILID